MKTALITGAGRKGALGYETARLLGKDGYHVIISGRDLLKLNPLVDELKAEGISASAVELDVTDEASAKNAFESISKDFDALDALINNAALLWGITFSSIEEQTMDELRSIFDTNVVGAWNVTQKMLPLIQKSKSGRIVNVSSGAGSFADPVFGLLNSSMGASSYGISKTALNAVTVKMARDLKKYHILVNAVCPDVTLTRDDENNSNYMGRPVSESAKSVVWAVNIPNDGPTGGFYRDGNELPW